MICYKCDMDYWRGRVIPVLVGGWMFLIHFNGFLISTDEDDTN